MTHDPRTRQAIATVLGVVVVLAAMMYALSKRTGERDEADAQTLSYAAQLQVACDDPTQRSELIVIGVRCQAVDEAVEALENGETPPAVVLPARDSPDPDDPEIQQGEIQDPEVQDPERQQPEVQDPEVNDADPNDPEVQDPENQSDETNDPDPNDPDPVDDPDPDDPERQDEEIQDPEIDDPDPNSLFDFSVRDECNPGDGETATDISAAFERTPTAVVLVLTCTLRPAGPLTR